MEGGHDSKDFRMLNPGHSLPETICYRGERRMERTAKSRRKAAENGHDRTTTVALNPMIFQFTRALLQTIARVRLGRCAAKQPLLAACTMQWRNNAALELHQEYAAHSLADDWRRGLMFSIEAESRSHELILVTMRRSIAESRRNWGIVNKLIVLENDLPGSSSEMSTYQDEEGSLFLPQSIKLLFRSVPNAIDTRVRGWMNDATWREMEPRPIARTQHPYKDSASPEPYMKADL
ncbi:hypothetical protein TELCIR_01272 [Teladorsagia circumcincta]|uniref:Uncharacterized protein n=1 Tax=Teladorsagia circumcincta TaxID=45464 RepID=A0A2G9V2Q2_TELCI|nr:hypothetical protein TELCIR_01272 [Teladorsagia circumcincta]